MNAVRTVKFLRDLKAHNHKAWFDAHRAEYDAVRAELAELVQQVILLVGKFDPAVRPVTAKDAMYRIHRDIRFSKDKRPYKTNVGAAIHPGGRKGEMPGYHFHIDANGEVMVAGGLYMVTPQQLRAVRAAIARQPGKLRAIVRSRAFRTTFGGLDDTDRLQRPPRGVAPDHPDLELLKLKRYVAWTEWPVAKVPAKALPGRIAATARVLHPLIVYLRGAVA
jgi:uncharacterized protein (TIGR02453 family)